MPSVRRGFGAKHGGFTARAEQLHVQQHVGMLGDTGDAAEAWRKRPGMLGWTENVAQGKTRRDRATP
ncbi:hypothetical protein DHEL01_v211748 [Diaporthe helianthi]|uniref:Uncharacterized protein n=1 Tax=Diaporthe helianthi TaxID=158607 RepID=A0A2P5HHY5_DIAHE|nr:hypothetical protein DHEL01_v211748 [Diaporthe helianthi]